MSENANVLPDQPIAQITVGQLESLIAAIVRRVVREELHRDHYVDEHGVKVSYAVEETAPAYLVGLMEKRLVKRQGAGRSAVYVFTPDKA